MVIIDGEEEMTMSAITMQNNGTMLHGEISSKSGLIMIIRQLTCKMGANKLSASPWSANKLYKLLFLFLKEK